MKVLLTHAYFLSEDAKEQAIMKPYPPLGILFISAYLKKHQIDVSVFDTTFSTVDEFKKHILDLSPSLVGIYTNLMTKVKVLELIAFIKSHPSLATTKIALGGPEITHNQRNYLNAGADVLVIGEGEESMLELSKSMLSPNDFPWSTIDGLAFLDKEGNIIQTNERQKRKNLDEIPWPDREAIDLEQYMHVWKKRHGKNAISISTMRGCPYTCKWCSRAVYGLSYRRRSPEGVAEEMAYLKKRYQPDSLWFVDDVFTISHQWLRAFTEKVNALDAVIPYECISRSDRMNEEVIQLLKKSGCYRVWIGAESGSQDVIDAMDRRVDVNNVREMIQLTRKNGIEAGTFIMLGYPGETLKDVEETVHHLKVSAPDHYTITLAYPINGTDMYKEVERDLIYVPDWQSSSDRDIQYKRTYGKKFYSYALAYVRHEVEWHKNRHNILKNPWSVAKMKAKASIARVAMVYSSLF